MTRHTLQDAYSGICPTPEQKDRMLRRILERKAARGTHFQRRKPSAGFRPATLAACLSLVVVLVGAVWLGRSRIQSAAGSGTLENSAPALLSGENSLPADDGETAAADTGPATATRATESAGEKTSDSAENPTETTAEAEALYRPILEKYVTAIQAGMTLPDCAEAGISTLVGYLTDLSQLGWWMTDLDGNATQELIISDGNVIYDLYTVTDGSVVHIFSGHERNSYRLCENNLLKNSGSNGAASSVYSIYRLVGKNLVQEQVVTYDGIKDPDNGWFIGFEETPATYEEAQELLDGYREVTIPQTLLSDWS